ncbi:MAG: transcription elongation factor GreA [Candidatus Magasanikbacteria bacterium]|jgi:transcription elongation factor GreA
MQGDTQYLSAESLETLKFELAELKSKTLPDISHRIDEAKQQGDLSENAEYHQAREDMSWAQGRLQELEEIINNAQIITRNPKSQGTIELGSTISVKINGATKQYQIVGQQESKPAEGLISNESPLGRAFMGHEAGDEVEVMVPAGKQVYKVVSVA